MKMKSLCALIGLSLLVGSTQAAEWYVAPSAGVSFNDEDRMVKDDESIIVGVGLGRNIGESSSLEFAVDYTDRNLGSGAVGYTAYDGDFSSVALTATLRHFFREEGMRPYILAGLGVSQHNADQPIDRESDGWDPVFDVGGGVMGKIGSTNPSWRTEVAYRADFDDESIIAKENFGDLILRAGLIIPFGSGEDTTPASTEEVVPEATPETAPKAEEPAMADSDGDGVADAADKCPGTPAGTPVGPDGCEQAVVIDLRGVNFAFDKSELTAESTAILDQAVEVLTRYPNLKVEVAGHTDSVGTDQYNQGLSERRAKVVHAYLTGKGIDAARLAGPNGYGEAKPIDTNDTSEGRARNRRTELNKQ